MISRRAFMPIWVIISVVIALFVFFILLNFFSDKLHFLSVNIRDCESKGGSCIEDSKCLPPLKTLPFKCEQVEGKEKIVCCK